MQKEITTFGVLGAIKYLAARRRQLPQKTISLRPNTVDYPLSVRVKNSDVDVMHGIFIQEEYKILKEFNDIDLIIDCGANAGYSSAYFLSQFKESTVVAVEPDPENFNMLENNLLPYGPRAKTLRAGIWSSTAGLIIERGTYRDGRSWAIQVREAHENEKPQITGIDITTILESTGKKRISILKIDIEGAEVEMFSKNYETWFDRVDVLCIEIHDDSFFGSASDVVLPILKKHGFTLNSGGCETVIAKRANACGVLAKT